MKKLSITLIFLVPLAVGCSTNLGTVAKAISQDGAIITARTPTMSITRVGTTTNEVRVNPDGSIVINPSLQK